MQHTKISINVYGALPGVKRWGNGVDQPPPSSAGVKKEWTYTSTPTLRLNSMFCRDVYLIYHMKHYTVLSKGSRTEFFTAFLPKPPTGPRLNYVVEAISHKSTNWR